jgi:hypothetical protein
VATLAEGESVLQCGGCQDCDRLLGGVCPQNLDDGLGGGPLDRVPRHAAVDKVVDVRRALMGSASGHSGMERNVLACMPDVYNSVCLCVLNSKRRHYL